MLAGPGVALTTVSIRVRPGQKWWGPPSELGPGLMGDPPLPIQILGALRLQGANRHMVLGSQCQENSLLSPSQWP